MKNVKNLVKKVLMVMMVGVVGFAGMASCGGSKEETKAPVQQEQQVEEEEKEVGNLKVGDTFENDEFSVKINKVRTTKQRNEFSDTKAKRVFIVEYTYVNKSDNKMFLFGDYFQGYDKEGEVLEHYEVIDYKYPKEISKGKKCTAETVFALNNKDNHVTLELVDNLFDGDVLATWDIEVK